MDTFIAIRLKVFDLKGSSVCSPQPEVRGSAPLILSDASISDTIAEAVEGDGHLVQSDCGDNIVIAAPMRLEDMCVGALVGFIERKSVSCEMIQSLKSLLTLHANMLAGDVWNRHLVADLSTEVLERYEELSMVFGMHEALDVNIDQDHALDVVFELFSETIEASTLVLSVPHLNLFKVFPNECPESGNLASLVEVLGTRAFAMKRDVVVNHIEHDEELCTLANGFFHALATSVSIDKSRGTFIVLRDDENSRFYTGDVSLFQTVAAQITVILSNTEVMKARNTLLEEVERQNIELAETRDVSVFALARLTESRDSDTGKHIERVRDYSTVLVKRLGEMDKYRDYITPLYVADIYRSTPLHDIGKIGIPDKILLKEGKLTPDEWEIMKTHAAIGGDTLRDAEHRVRQHDSTFLSMGRAIAYSHHEKWNGEGYPLGLAGTDIPLAARIVALADVYDALTCKRCYKPAFSHEKARKIILEESGVQFDPDVVDAFLATEESILEIKERLKETEPDD